MNARVIASCHAFLLVAVCGVVLAVILAASCHAQDPVAHFIAVADSLARTASAESLTVHVSRLDILSGAAVSRLLDEAIEAGDAGDQAGEGVKIGLAGRIADLHRSLTGSSALAELVRRYQKWGPDERALRRKAKEIEREASAAQTEKRFDDAIDLLHRALEIYQSIDDRCSEAVIYGTLGVAAYYAGDFTTVREYYLLALDARRRVENNILVGRTLNGLGTAALMLEDYQASADFYRDAIDLRRRTGDVGGLGTSLTYLGNALTKLSRLAEARDAFAEALVIVESAGNPKQLCELLISIATLQSSMGRIRESNESYRKALAIAVANGDARMQIICHMNLALNMKDAFHYPDALAELDSVETLLAESPDPVQSTLLHRNRGETYLVSGDLDRARTDLVAYLERARAEGMHEQEAEAMVKLGYLYLELGALPQGLALSDSVLLRANRTGSRVLAREAHVLAAKIEEARGAPVSCRGHFEKALAEDRAAGNETNMLIDELGIANATALEGRGVEARAMYRGLAGRVRAAGADDLLLSLSLGIGHSFENENADSARAHYERALELMERTRAGIGGAEFGSSYFAGMRRHYSEEIARYYARVAQRTGEERWSSEAFRTMERAKARGLLDLIERSLAHEHSPAEGAVLDSLYRLDPAAPGYADSRRLLERRYQGLRDARLDATTGRLLEKREVPGLDEIRESLPRGTALFAYALGDSSSFLWAIDRKRATLFELPERGAIRDDVTLMASALANPASADEALRRSARRLYLTLLAPADLYVERNERFVIVPDDCLFELPFEGLLDADAGANVSWSNCPFLAKEHLIVYAPSVSVYLKLRKPAAAEWGLDLLAVGDPAYAMSADTTAPVLRALPHSRGEVVGIAGNFKPERRLTLLGASATEAALKQMLAERRPQLLHFAAHGLVDPVNPAASHIALLPDSAAADDGSLHTLEILALPLNCRLVTLSACESGRGRIGRSEGVVGLSRAFIAAGASCVVSSLWAVSDESTSRLMQAFYRSMIRDKRSAVTALNEARLELLRTPGYGHPFYWASFTAVGSERAPWGK